MTFFSPVGYIFLRNLYIYIFSLVLTFKYWPIWKSMYSPFVKSGSGSKALITKEITIIYDICVNFVWNWWYIYFSFEEGTCIFCLESHLVVNCRHLRSLESHSWQNISHQLIFSERSYSSSNSSNFTSNGII